MFWQYTEEAHSGKPGEAPPEDPYKGPLSFDERQNTMRYWTQQQNWLESGQGGRGKLDPVTMKKINCECMMETLFNSIIGSNNPTDLAAELEPFEEEWEKNKDVYEGGERSPSFNKLKEEAYIVLRKHKLRH